MNESFYYHRLQISRLAYRDVIRDGFASQGRIERIGDGQDLAASVPGTEHKLAKICQNAKTV